MRLLTIFLLILNLQCSNKICEIKKVQRIQAIEAINNGFVSYHHEGLMEGFSSSCMDSTQVFTMIAKYIDTCGFKPVAGITILKSKSGYDVGETISQSKEYSKNRVLTVYFVQGSTIPSEFYFYKNGKTIYEGSNWLR